MFVFGTFKLQAEALFSKEELDNPRKYAWKFDSVFRLEETPKLKIQISRKQVILHNNYASAEISNPEYWRADYRPDSIHMILSHYPKDKEKWITNFYDLLANRLKELYKVDPRLNNPYLTHVLILQTACATEEEAKALFHGFIIYARKAGNPIVRKDIKVNAREIDIEKNELEIDTTFYPLVNLCSIDGWVYTMAEFRGHVYISWQNGVLITKDTFNSFQAADQGLTDPYIKSFAVFNNRLYGMGHGGKIWSTTDSVWRLVYRPTAGADTLGESLFTNGSVLIATYTNDDFYVSTDGLRFYNRFYRESAKGILKRRNLSPVIRNTGDSLWLFSGSGVYLSTDNLLNIRKVHTFRKKQLDFAHSVLMTGTKTYLTGWFQDDEYQHHQSFLVNPNYGKSWQKIMLPEKGSTFNTLYQKEGDEAIWVLGSGQLKFKGRRAYIRKGAKWYVVELAIRSIYLNYGGYYVGQYGGGIMVLIPESEVVLD